MQKAGAILCRFEKVSHPKGRIISRKNGCRFLLCTGNGGIDYKQGRFHLFDPVAKFIPAFDKLKVFEGNAAGETKEVDLVRPITLRDLLTHTAAGSR